LANETIHSFGAKLASKQVFLSYVFWVKITGWVSHCINRM
jgi:hypothetical protein